MSEIAARWWQFAVVRGAGIPAHLDGMWFDLDELESPLPTPLGAATLRATNRWEQRDDGAVAVVYEWFGEIEHFDGGSDAP